MMCVAMSSIGSLAVELIFLQWKEAFGAMMTSGGDERFFERERRLLRSWAKAGKDIKGEVKLREAKATTFGRVLLARSCARGGAALAGSPLFLRATGPRAAGNGFFD